MMKNKEQVKTSLRSLPGVDRLLELSLKEGIFNINNRYLPVFLIRSVLSSIRDEILTHNAPCPDYDKILFKIKSAKDKFYNKQIKHVINATGIVLHTNLGRAPLSREVLRRLEDICYGYCNLEFDLEKGIRGHRGEFVESLINIITGAESSIIVNNCAAAVYLSFAGLASQKEVITSRGELVQIGGGFKIPEIMEASGCKLIEVGTTNITNIKDYQKALNVNTAMLLKVHRSNFVISGHTESCSIQELSKLAANKSIPFLMDLGSGALFNWNAQQSGNEQTVQEILKSGADLVTFSGDKLLGSSQGGFIIGKKQYIDKIRSNPIYRILRPEKITLFLLQETLKSYIEGNVEKSVPLWKMLKMPKDKIMARLKTLKENLELNGIKSKIISTNSAVGGGTFPDQKFKTDVLILDMPDTNKFSRKLLNANPPVVTRITKENIIIDLRSVLEEEDQIVKDTIINLTK